MIKTFDYLTLSVYRLLLRFLSIPWDRIDASRPRSRVGQNVSVSDFDGSFGDVTISPKQEAGNPPPCVGNPYQAGTMTRTSADTACFDYASGSIQFARHIGRKIVPRLCSYWDCFPHHGRRGGRECMKAVLLICPWSQAL